MKKLFSILILFTCFCTYAQAQKNKLSKEEFRARQEAFITENAKLTQQEAKEFFPLYFELQDKKSAYNREAWQEIRKGKQGNLSEEEYASIVEALIQARITTDRNRTSPFAFTGNRFEFRAPGSEANCASAMIALNTAVAEQLIQFKKDVDNLIEQGEPKISAIIEVVRRYIKECKPIRFDGNGYSEEWKEEAARRGLDCETSCPLIFDNYLKPDTIRMFESTGVMNRKELEARNEVKWEMYTKKIQIEARVLGDLVMNHVVPVAIEYQTKLIDNAYKMKSLFDADEAKTLSAENIAIIKQIAEHTGYIKEHVDAMVEARKVANKIEDQREKAIAYHDTIAPMLEQIRYHIDKLELIVDDQMWTLPKYRELLFVR